MSAPTPETWCAGQAECLSCNHTWPAVWILGCGPLQCPNCGSGDTVRGIGASAPTPPITH